VSSFLHPWFLLLVPLLFGFGAWLLAKRKKRYPTVRISTLQAVINEPSWKAVLRQWLLPALRGLGLFCLIVALARPQETFKEQDIKADGIDIMLSLDVSSSMLARDFTPDRLTASKVVAKDFIARREFDRIGLVVFSGEAFTQCPLTSDHDILDHFLDNLRCGQLEDGTAIGMGLATAVNRIKDSKAKSKVIILLTDGVNNSGYVQPDVAAELAQTFGIKVYTIGVGSTGRAFAPIGRRGDGDYIFSYIQVEIDEALLLQIAQKTGGRYFRATDEKSLQKIYAEIDELEKTAMDVTAIQRDVDTFPVWLRWAALFLMLELALRWTILRSLP
jgi:Ca-activated chloride channel homolog